MKVRLLVARASAEGSNGPGDEINVDNDEAKRLIESGQAEPVARKQQQRAEKRPSNSRKEQR